jgi:hypothetical protein
VKEMGQARYVVRHGASSREDGKTLTVITIFEPGVPKSSIREQLPYTKNWGILSLQEDKADWVKPLKEVQS